MSCQCHQIGGPFIAEDPDCLIHGTAATQRERAAEHLRQEAAESTDIAVLRRIVDDLARLATEIY